MNGHDRSLSDTVEAYHRLMLVEQQRKKALFECCKVLMVALRNAGAFIRDQDLGDPTNRDGWKSDEALAACDAISDTFDVVTAILNKELKQ